MIRERHAETRSTNAPGTKSAVGLFLQAYRDEKMSASNSKSHSNSGSLDLGLEFLLLARNNIKILLLGSHDTTTTTTTTTAFTFALLSENLAELECIRAEHDSVLGPIPALQRRSSSLNYAFSTTSP